MKYLSTFERWFYGLPFLWLLLTCWQSSVTASELGLFGGQGIRDVFAEFDLLLAIKIPPEEGITFVDGSDGFPAFGVASNADIKSPYRTILPEKLTEFTIIATVRPGTRSGGYIFSVVNPLDTVVQLGLLLEPILASDQWNVTLIYTDANVQRVSQPLASFQIPYTKSWIKLIFKVMSNQVVFYNNCVETETVTVKKDPRMLIFDAASTLYIAQAGPILKRSFEGTLLFLKLYGNPEIVKTHCNRTATELDDSSNVIYEEDDFLRDSDDIGGELFADDHIGVSSGDDDDSLFEPPMISPPPPEYGYRSKGDKGERGPKGPPGDSIRGPPGPPGPQGSPGPPGPPGAAGPKGSGLFDEGSGDDAIYDAFPNRKFPNQCFCNVTLIMEELKMDSTLREYLRGPEGPKGREGKTGSPGLTGATGPAGERGVAGPKGDKGDRGDPGLPGTEGIQGSKGEPGLDGMPGPAGLPGTPGPPGIPENYDGHTSIGAPGPKGSVGPSGVPGIPGQTGSPGTKGDKGNTGDVGPAGPAGPPGMVVYTDAKNSTGSSDCHCQPGPPGAPGMRGPVGHDGTPGLPGETGLPGHPGLPGDKGDKGSAGSKGEKGPEFIINENASFNSTRTTKGEKGERGPRGRRGKPGPIGPPGKPASPSDMGINSWSTLKGDKGPKGDRGDVGLRGPKGESGKDGIDGKPGPPGQYIPLPGPPGPPGPPGLPGVSIAGEKGDPGMDSRSPFFGDPNFAGRPGSRSSFDELKQLRELKHHRELEDSTAGPPGPPGPPGRTHHYDNSDSEVPNTRIVPGAVTFQNTDAMSRMSSTSPVGTLAYIIDEEALLVRVNKGWQYIALGTLVPIATPAPPTTTVIPPPHRPDLQASNLINNIPQPLEGPSLRMGALNEPFSGDMQGIRGADYNCYRQARRAGLLGTFRAFLSSRITNLDTIVRISDRGLPVVNTRGDVLFNSWNSIFNGQGGYFPQTPRIYSFSGKNVLTDITWPQKLVWHGASALGERAMDTYCDSWHSDSTDKVGLASSLLGNKLLDQDRYSCDNRFIVLCVEALPHEQRRRKRDVSRHTIEFTNEEDYNRHLAEVLQET